jgi:hypothetical protein
MVRYFNILLFLLGSGFLPDSAIGKDRSGGPGGQPVVMIGSRPAGLAAECAFRAMRKGQASCLKDHAVRLHPGIPFVFHHERTFVPVTFSQEQGFKTGEATRVIRTHPDWYFTFLGFVFPTIAFLILNRSFLEHRLELWELRYHYGELGLFFLLGGFLSQASLANEPLWLLLAATALGLVFGWTGKALIGWTVGGAAFWLSGMNFLLVEGFGWQNGVLIAYAFCLVLLAAFLGAGQYLAWRIRFA